ncbi:hypothetical protein GF337_16235 [candidate division KSB1 bacterium]|nr:hypothetical protein [candidate division KSB1 bacterium]
MYQVIYHEDNKIEFSIREELTTEEFQQIIHQLESLCTMHSEINVLFDAAGLEKYASNVIWEEYDFYKKYKTHLKRLALVSDRTFESFILKQLNKFSDTEFKAFGLDQIEEARKWIFPSKLPS